MATTTNYGWTTPDDTDLVKDGAAAIRTLGSSVDTTTKALNPETTTGDIAYRSATANTNTRLALGTAGQVLTVNTGATAPQWAAPASGGGMTLISTTTLTGASVVLSSIPQTHKDLLIIVRNYQGDAGDRQLRMRFNNDSGANRHGVQLVYGNDVNNAFNLDYALIGTDQHTSTATGLTKVEIPDYTNTATWKMCQTWGLTVETTAPTNFATTTNVGVFNQIGAITSLGFLLSGGNFDGGTILLYGVK